ncbi:MAG: aldose epimerase [Acidobacteriaceae bacterium]|nr:aldose epimerase [Acidobacteriaceae bacterium]
MQGITLQNELASATIMPAQGGRVASLRSLLTGVEFLWQAPTPWSLRQPGEDANFAHGAAAGIEECLPTVARCEAAGTPLPDHGDFWQLPWQVLAVSANAATLRAEGFSLPLAFEKTYTLRGAALCLESKITNIGAEDTSFLYAAHPLLAVDEGDRIVLPDECANLALFDSRHTRLGHKGTQLSWPQAALASGEGVVDLSLIGAFDDDTAEMLYTPRLLHGVCGLYRSAYRQGISLYFSEDSLPWMGLWICCGGWPDDGSPRQYAFAPEPTSAPCGSLSQALAESSATVLSPGASFNFSLEFALSDSGIDLADFTARTLHRA